MKTISFVVDCGLYLCSPGKIGGVTTAMKNLMDYFRSDKPDDCNLDVYCVDAQTESSPSGLKILPLINNNPIETIKSLHNSYHIVYIILSESSESLKQYVENVELLPKNHSINIHGLTLTAGSFLHKFDYSTTRYLSSQTGLRDPDLSILKSVLKSAPSVIVTSEWHRDFCIKISGAKVHVLPPFPLSSEDRAEFKNIEDRNILMSAVGTRLKGMEIMERGAQALNNIAEVNPGKSFYIQFYSSSLSSNIMSSFLRIIKSPNISISNRLFSKKMIRAIKIDSVYSASFTNYETYGISVLETILYGSIAIVPTFFKPLYHSEDFRPVERAGWIRYVDLQSGEFVDSIDIPSISEDSQAIRAEFINSLSPKNIFTRLLQIVEETKR